MRGAYRLIIPESTIEQMEKAGAEIVRVFLLKKTHEEAKREIENIEINKIIKQLERQV
jgi:hypothetical protein